MSRFLMDRGILENDIWLDPVAFRLFFYLIAKASFKDGVKVRGAELKKGQWFRSYRNLQYDLEYEENNGLRRYNLSKISRAVTQLEIDGRITVKHTELGTLFTVVNYESYQVFPGSTTQTDETSLRQAWDGLGTDLEQAWNKNNYTRTKSLTKTERGGGKKQKKPATPTPENFQITERQSRWATEKLGAVNWLNLETEKFLNYHRAKDSRFSDWEAAWKNWMLKAKEYRGNEAPTQGLQVSEARKEKLQRAFQEGKPLYCKVDGYTRPADSFSLDGNSVWLDGQPHPLSAFEVWQEDLHGPMETKSA